MHTIRHVALLLAMTGLALAGCSKKDAAAKVVVAEARAKSVPDKLDNAYNLQDVAEALKETGFASVLKGSRSYTLLAPEDAALDGFRGNRLEGGDDRAPLTALLRAHMIPGYVTPQAIARAIDTSKTGKVSLPNLDGQPLQFARLGTALVVTAPDGSQARLDGKAIHGGASIAIPLDGVLKKGMLPNLT